MKQYTPYILGRLVRCFSAAAFLAMAACADDPEPFAPQLPAAGGSEVLVDINVVVPEMEAVSRGVTDRVGDIWVGIYNAATGLSTLCEDDGAAQGRYFELDGYDDTHVMHTLPSLRTKHGLSYIVAVANTADNYGLSAAIDPACGRRTLRELLQQADTWEKFLSIAYSRGGSASQGGYVLMPASPMVMSGCFYADNGSASHSGADWESLNFTPVEISSAKPLKGAIHLRRSLSQVTFNVGVAPDAVAGLQLQMYGWRVVNVPEYSWVYERSAKAGVANASDAVLPAGRADEKLNFAPSPEISTINTSSFSFWQMENKRTGTSTAYNQREKEDGGTGSGIFTYLKEDGRVTMNNYATYVEIKCLVTFRDEIEGGINRSADVTYRVHLGAVGNDYADFNCRRNHRYTYNVLVKDVNSLIVEALDKNETVPGANGTVTDTTRDFVELDAHFHAFNIELTQAQRTGAATATPGVFPFRILVWENDQMQAYSQNDDIPAKYLNWVELRPTTDKATLAAYKPHSDTGHSNADGKTFRLNEMAQLTLNGVSTLPAKGNWYTVFIHENVYESSSNEAGTAWRGYVNQPNRCVWLCTSQNASDDNHTFYIKSEYAFSQKSIQTYYSAGSDGAESALGMEHRNESFGLNLRAFDATGTSTSYNLNGRYNLYKYLGTNTSWSARVSATPFSYPSITNAYQEVIGDGTTVDPSGATYLPSLVKTTKSGYSGGDSIATDFDPTSSKDYYEVKSACLNRNLDLNGNGKIDVDEMRWYVPTTEQYIEMIIGFNALATPLMEDYAHVGISTIAPSGNFQHANTRYHFYAANNSVVWGLEGMSTSPNTSSGYSHWQHGAWQVRCVRNLGTNLASTPPADGSEVTDIIKSDADNTIRLNAFNPVAYRDKYVDGNDMKAHHIYSDDNRLYRAFQYKPASEEFSAAYKMHNWYVSLKTNNPCAKYNTNGEKGWRLPNQKEIALLETLGLLTTNRGYITSTYEYYNKTTGKGIWNDPLPESDTTYPNRRFMGKSASGHNLQAMDDGSYYIKCVRDVD